MRLYLLLLASALGGCQAMVMGTAADFNQLSLGMPKEEVVRVMGEPNRVAADAQTNEEHLIYRRMPQVLGWLPHNYDVTLVSGKVVKYGDIVK